MLSDYEWYNSSRATPVFKVHVLELLQMITSAVDDTTLAKVFTQPHLDAVTGRVMVVSSWDTLVLEHSVRIVIRLTQAIPSYAAQLVSHNGFQQLLRALIPKENKWGVNNLSTFGVHLCDAILSANSSGITTASTVLLMLETGVVQCCVSTLFAIALCTDLTKADDTSAARLLRVLRVMLDANVSRTKSIEKDRQIAGAAISTEASTPAGTCTNQANAPIDTDVVTTFVDARGPQALDILRYSAVMQQDGHALKEFTLLSKQLENMPEAACFMSATKTTVDSEVQQAFKDERAFTESYDGNWLRAFEAHISRTLEKQCGYPAPVLHSNGNDGTTRNTSEAGSQRSPNAGAAQALTEAQSATVPSAAALQLLQAKARVSILAHKRLIYESCGNPKMTTSVLFNPLTLRHDTHHFLLFYDLNRFPSYQVHFLLASKNNALGWHLHQCFVPPGHTAATLPYVTLYSGTAPCATAPLTLGDYTDVAYGEYMRPDDTVVYPPGTLLMCPRNVVPLPPANRSPVFLVFKPCPASLLRGAVPVGRIVQDSMSTEAPQVHSYKPFTNTVRYCFEKFCSMGVCSKQGSTMSSYFKLH